MDDKVFLNNDVSKIVNITPRQVLSWTDKGLVVPFREAAGAGSRRQYNYLNLLEFSLCDVLFLKGNGIQKIKNVLNHLRAGRVIERWALNFKEYFIEAFARVYTGIILPKENIGILMIFYDDTGEDISLVPTDMYNAMNLTSVRERCVRSIAVDIIDIGKIKTMLDKKME
jgi:DNA-binding transcriptional MerR regulator